MSSIVSPVVDCTAIHANDNDESNYLCDNLKILAVFNVTKAEAYAQSSKNCDCGIVGPGEVDSPLTLRACKNE